MPAPTRSDWISEARDLSRISASSEAQLSRYTAWISTALTGLGFIAARKAAKSSSPYAVGLHMRGLWLKIWIASQPFSTPRSIALSRPPAGDTWAPISML